MEEIAQVYARSLFEVARDRDRIDVVREQLGQFADALDENRELQVFFFSPYFSTEEKVEGLRRTVQDADDIVLNTLALLIENHRMPAIHRIRRTYDGLWREHNKLLPVQITSAVALDESVVQRVSEEIGRQTGRQVELTTRVDESVLGGLVLQVGNQILDASIRSRLERLRRQVTRA
jgi:F-type H+-transporting ATPase subunit delta